MSMPCHMLVEGDNQGAIAGSCDLEGREDTILIQALDHEVMIPNDLQTGLSTGKRIHKPFTVTKEIDKSSPLLYQALTTGEHLSNVELKFYRISPKGEEEHYFTVKLIDAILVSIKSWFPNALDAKNGYLTHMEDLSFTYSNIIWTWEVDGIESEDNWKKPVSA